MSYAVSIGSVSTAGGTAIRYMLSKSYHANPRTDFAWGKGNFT
jgi:hypothetical protein